MKSSESKVGLQIPVGEKSRVKGLDRRQRRLNGEASVSPLLRDDRIEVEKKPNVIPGRKIVVKTPDRRLDRIPKEDGIVSPLLRGSQESLSNATKPNVTQSAGDTQDLRFDQNSKPREAVKRQRVEPVDPTKPNVTESVGDTQDLKSDQNSKPREAVKRQRVDPVDPTKPNVTESAGDSQDLRSDQNSKPREAVKRQRAETTDPLTESKLKLTKTTPTVTGLDAPTNKNEVASVAGKKVEDLRIYLDYKKRMRANDPAAVPEVRTTSKFKQDEAVPSPSHSRQKTTSGSPSLQGWMRKDNRQSRSTRFNTSNQLL
jgi:hypothetical protein